jgi:hypothetical protein
MMILNDLDPSRRPDVILQQGLHTSAQDPKNMIKRAFNMAIPFVQLHPTYGRESAVLLGAYHLFTPPPQNPQQPEDPQQEFIRKIRIVACIALAIVAPKVETIVSTSIRICDQALRISSEMKQDKKKALSTSVFMTSNIVYLGALFLASPQILVVSVVFQASLEFFVALIYTDAANRKNKKGERTNKTYFLEAAGLAALGTVRLYCLKRILNQPALSGIQGYGIGFRKVQ